MSSTVASTRFRDHPPGLVYLFFAELWERFSYYGLRAMLVFYVTKQFLMSQEQAFGIYGTYTALVYTTPIIGGMLADRILGDRRAIIFGGILIALGHITLTFNNETTLLLGLSFIVAGTGLFKPNVSALLGKLYAHGDHRRDAGFTLFYVGINVGGFLAPLTCGWVGEMFGWHYGFGLAAIGMLIGLLFFFKALPNLEGHGVVPAGIEEKKANMLAKIIYVLSFISIPIIALMLKNHENFTLMLTPVGVGVVAYMLFISFTAEASERWNILTILVLMFFYTAFFALFEQAGSSINFFTKLQVNREVLGYEIPATAFQSLNPLFVMIFGPIMAWVWIKLGVAKKEPYTPFKFFLGLLSAALGFVILSLSTKFADSAGLVSLWWIVFVYLAHTLGELCISPVGLSMVTKLAPARYMGFLMGALFLSLAFGNHMAGLLAKLSAVDTNINEATATLGTYSEAFTSVAYVGIAVTIVILLLSPLLNGVFKREEKLKGYNE